MAAESAIPTRADEIGRYIQLEALEMVLHSIALEVLGEEEVATAGLVELLDSLWPADSNYEGTVEWRLAQAESCAMTAHLFGWLASEAGRRYCDQRALESSRIGASILKEVRQKTMAVDA